MITRYLSARHFMILSVLFLSLMYAITGMAQVNAPGQIWQWSVKVQGAVNGGGQSRAYMWIPANCTKVRGMVLAQNNMEEFSILENQNFRDEMASIGFGEIWVAPGFNMVYNVQEGARDVFTQIMIDLANESGYMELKNVPMVPMGHSATANFPFAFAAGSPERTLCGVSVSGMFAYDFGNLFGKNTQCGGTADYIPLLTTIGEFEGAGDASTNMTKVFNRRAAHPYTPMTMLPCAGEYHFATSQAKTDFIAYYIKKAATYRLAVDATSTSLATLTPIDPTTTGWLVDRWRKNMSPRYPRAAVSSYTGKKALINSTGEENFWCFDEEMAAKIETYQNQHFRKTPALIAYNQSTTAGVVGAQVAQNNNHVQVHLDFIPLNDSLDFELSSSFLNTIPAMSTRCAGWMSTTDPSTGVVTNGTVGASITFPSDNSLSVIDRTIGPLTKLRKDANTGITTFRMTLERGLAPTLTNYSSTAIFSVAHPGDATYKASVLQAEMGIAVKNTSGLSQTIDFAQLPDVSNTTVSIPLNATSDRGLPVQYFVREGPADVVYTSSGAKLVFKEMPLYARFPMKVTVVAWQWGRDAGLASRISSGILPGQTVQSAEPVYNTFYLVGGTLPVRLTSFSAKSLSDKVALSWETAGEVNLQEFQVERASEPANWSNIGNVQAKGMPSAYRLDDFNPLEGISYYRLKSLDAGNSSAYSKTLTIYRNTQNVELSYYNNTVFLRGAIAGAKAEFTVITMAGNKVFNKSQIVSGSKSASVNLPPLETGVYLVNVKSDGFVKTLKILVN